MKVLITGITGTLGQALYPLFLENGDEVIGVSRDEFKQSLVPRTDKLTLYLCDVRDRDRLLEASRGCDLIFHLAAMKRIECCEEQPEEAASINVKGTENVLFCQRLNRIPRVVLVSTDKACEPITAYGFTKALAERLTLRNPNNVVCRYGNVLSSRGSVVGTFRASIERDGKIEITDRRCTRFWWTISEAAEYVYHCAKRPEGGLCIPNLKAAPVVSIGKILAEVLGRPAPHIEEIGFRGIEKTHELLRTEDEGGRESSDNQTLWFTKSELKKVLEGVVA